MSAIVDLVLSKGFSFKIGHLKNDDSYMTAMHQLRSMLWSRVPKSLSARFSSCNHRNWIHFDGGQLLLQINEFLLDSYYIREVELLLIAAKNKHLNSFLQLCCALCFDLRLQFWFYQDAAINQACPCINAVDLRVLKRFVMSKCTLLLMAWIQIL